jgi:hypothetical protein
MAASSIFLTVVAAVALVLVATGLIGPIFLIPVAVIVLIGLLAAPLLGRLRDSAVAQPDSGPTGVPTTRDASYEPVQDPRDRGA